MEDVKRKVEQEQQLVIFSLYGEEFGLEITKVREIVKPRSRGCPMLSILWKV